MQVGGLARHFSWSREGSSRRSKHLCRWMRGALKIAGMGERIDGGFAAPRRHVTVAVHLEMVAAAERTVNSSLTLHGCAAMYADKGANRASVD